MECPLRDVTANKHQYKPVASFTMTGNCFHMTGIETTTGMDLQEKESNLGYNQSNNSNEEGYASQNGQDDVPKPEKDENFFVQNVDW